ncbi:MAG: hypothetical protein PUP93_31120 [Rhizonema sp. NSF051]|nr:hypothetical protein [Rhizonema sp. NSF051]
MKAKTKNASQHNPISKAVIFFGELPITIYIPAGTIKVQQEELKKRILANCESLVTQGVWDAVPDNDEIVGLIQKAKIKPLSRAELANYESIVKMRTQKLGVRGHSSDTKAPIVSYNREINKEAMELLSNNARRDSWEHTGIYATYNNPNVARLPIEVHALWKNVCNATNLVTDEQMEVDPRYVIPAGEFQTLMSLPMRVAEYKKRHKLT